MSKNLAHPLHRGNRAPGHIQQGLCIPELRFSKHFLANDCIGKEPIAMNLECAGGGPLRQGRNSTTSNNTRAPSYTSTVQGKERSDRGTPCIMGGSVSKRSQSRPALVARNVGDRIQGGGGGGAVVRGLLLTEKMSGGEDFAALKAAKLKLPCMLPDMQAIAACAIGNTGPLTTMMVHNTTGVCSS